MQKELVSSIVSIFNKVDNIELDYSIVEAQPSSTLYSSTKKAIWRLFIDGNETTRHTPYLIKYVCLSCKHVSQVSMTQFMRKLNKENPTKCYMCVNKDDNKRLIHSEFMTGKNIRSYSKNEKPKLSILDECNDAIERFSNLDELSKEKYMACHMNDIEYRKILPHLQSLRNGNIRKDIIERCKYIYTFPCNNHTKFTSVLYDPYEDMIIRFDQPIIKCENCNNTWRCKNIHILKNQHKIYCQYCKLCRKAFKKRNIKNLKGENVIYQSRPEKQFIEWCNAKNIYVINGPIVPYTHMSKEHKYIIDYYIPDIGFLVEIKDDHIWHKHQIESGVWTLKEKAALRLIDEDPLKYKKYIVIKPVNRANYLQEIENGMNKI